MRAVEALATATDDRAEVARVTRLLTDRYGLQFTAFMLVEKVVARRERGREVIHLHPLRPRTGRAPPPPDPFESARHAQVRRAASACRATSTGGRVGG